MVKSTTMNKTKMNFSMMKTKLDHLIVMMEHLNFIFSILFIILYLLKDRLQNLSCFSFPLNGELSETLTRTYRSGIISAGYTNNKLLSDVK